MAQMEFDAVVEATATGRGGTLVRLPPDAVDVFGTLARFPVKVRFGDVDYRGSTMPMGDGTFCVGIQKAIREQLGVDVGDTIHVVVERDDEERTVELPDDFRAALAAAGVLDRLEAMSYSHRREYAGWIAEAKKPETRSRRIEQAVEMISEGKPRRTT